MKPNLKVKIGKLELKNPIMVASGTFGYGEEVNENFYDISRLGAVVTKGISLKPRKGNPSPRIVETPSGMLNAIGLQNVGLEAFLKEKLPFLTKAGATVIVNILGETVEEYARLAKELDPVKGVSGIEVNISCPNVKCGGVQFGTDPKLAAKVTKAVKEATSKTVIVKLSPNYHDIPGMAKAVRAAGADASSLINTITGMAIDAETRRPVLANVIGGLSGPAIKPVALRMVWQASSATTGVAQDKCVAQDFSPANTGRSKDLRYKMSRFPVIGIGGIMNVTDVVEFLLAGATAVQVGTANFVDPMIGIKLVSELEEYLEKRGIGDVGELVGELIV